MRRLHRRHLTSSQKAVVALEIEKYLAKEAVERQRAAAALTNAKLGREYDETLRQLFAEASRRDPHDRKACSQAATLVRWWK